MKACARCISGVAGLIQAGVQLSRLVYSYELNDLERSTIEGDSPVSEIGMDEMG